MVLGFAACLVCSGTSCCVASYSTWEAQVTDNDYGRGDDRFMRGAADKSVPKSKQGKKKGCPLLMSLMVSLPASLVIGTVVLAKPMFRR